MGVTLQETEELEERTFELDVTGQDAILQLC